MNYGGTVGGSGLGSGLGRDVPAEVKETVVSSQLNQIETKLGAMFATSERIHNAVYRIVNPRPADASKAQNEPPVPHTVEGRLNGIMRQLEMLHSFMEDSAINLDRAV